jgi:hypothetical protein
MHACEARTRPAELTLPVAGAGIWTKTITTRTGLPRTTITKVLKILENKKAVKTVKSVKVSNATRPRLCRRPGGRARFG